MASASLKHGERTLDILKGAALALAGSRVALIAPSGAGKSTLRATSPACLDARIPAKVFLNEIATFGPQYSERTPASAAPISASCIAHHLLPEFSARQNSCCRQ